MRQYFRSRSLHTQLVVVSVACVVTSAAVTAAVVTVHTWTQPGDSPALLRLRVLAAAAGATAFCLALLYTVINRLLRPLYQLRDALARAAEGHFDSSLDSSTGRDVLGMNSAFDRMLVQLRHAQKDQHASQAVLAARTRTVDRLLEFSQGVQAAGKPEQVYAALAHYLQADLQLAGLVMLAVDGDALPPTQVKAVHPLSVLKPDRPVGDLDSAACPCLRQHLPRHFRCDGSPVRCTIDQSLNLSAEHSAFCIPFRLGGKVAAVVHMLLDPAREWDEDLKHLAQTYVNTAQAALVTLHLLAEAENTSMTDGLTGMYNRRSLEPLLQREVALAERHGHPLSLVMIDMDKFKEVNDTHGHAAGDHMIRAFADTARMTLRRTDLAFRYGGDEFVIALPQTTVVQAKQVVQKLRQAFGTVDFSDAIAKLDHQPTLSIGVVERSTENGALTLPALLAAADAALYDAKNSDRNCVKVYSPTRDSPTRAA